MPVPLKHPCDGFHILNKGKICKYKNKIYTFPPHVTYLMSFRVGVVSGPSNSTHVSLILPVHPLFSLSPYTNMNKFYTVTQSHEFFFFSDRSPVPFSKICEMNTDINVVYY